MTRKINANYLARPFSGPNRIGWIYFILLLSTISLSRCHVVRSKTYTTVPDVFTLSGKWNCSWQLDETGTKGLCIQEKDSLFFERGSLATIENLSPSVDFLMAFRGNQYETFFEAIFFDTKLRRLYRDSVLVDSINLMKLGLNTVYPCKDCNVVVYCAFRQHQYLIPYRLPEYLLTRLEQFQYFETETPVGHQSIYIPKTILHPSGSQLYKIGFESMIQVYLRSSKSNNHKIKILNSINYFNIN